jgi:Lrp/AsnC family transcriptional regulator, regulator for asnA, asnC and gidA
MSNLDTLDHQIIVELRREGRLANTEIARRLGVSEATIRSRVQRLVTEGIIRVAASVNLTSLGYDIHVVIGIHCDSDRILDVMRELGEVREVRMVSAVSGQWDLLATASFRSKEDLFGFLTGYVANIAGVQKTETIHVLREAKRDSYYWEAQPLPADSLASGGSNGLSLEFAEAGVELSAQDGQVGTDIAGELPSRSPRLRTRRPN